MSFVHQLKQGDKVHVYNHYGILKNTNSERNTQFMGWLLKPSEQRIIFDGVIDSYPKTGIIKYSDALTNIGNGLKIDNGSFNVPVSGIYYFHFQGLATRPEANFINIKQNGEIVASTFRNKRMVTRSKAIIIIILS